MKEEVLDIYHDIMYLLVGAMYNVHNELGPGLNEYIYQEGLAIELTEQNIPYEREKEIIELRYGLNGKEELTQREIAKKLGISRSYVSRIETAALKKLRRLF